MAYNDPNRPVYDPVRTASDTSAFGGLLALLAIVALLVVGTYLVAPRSDGTRTAVNGDSKAPAPSPKAFK